MTFRDGLLTARGHIMFVLGLLIVFGLTMYLDRQGPVAGGGFSESGPDGEWSTTSDNLR